MGKFLDACLGEMEMGLFDGHWGESLCFEILSSVQQGREGTRQV